MPDPLRVVIAGGGTGGHLFPGISVAKELLARVPEAQISFAGTAHGIESRVIPREGFTLDLIRSAGLKGKSVAERARGFGLLHAAYMIGDVLKALALGGIGVALLRR